MKSYLSGFHLIKRVMHAAHYNAVYRLTPLGPTPDYSMLRRSWHHVASLKRELSAWKVLQVFRPSKKKNMFHVRVFQKKEEEGLFIFYFLKWPPFEISDNPGCIPC